MTTKNNEALQRLVNGINPEDASKLLASLCWREDTVIINHEGERVWLKVLYNEKGKRIGITDCCPEDNPCEQHKIVNFQEH